MVSEHTHTRLYSNVCTSHSLFNDVLINYNECVAHKNFELWEFCFLDETEALFQIEYSHIAMSYNLLHFIGHQCKLILHQKCYGLFHHHAWLLRVGFRGRRMKLHFQLINSDRLKTQSAFLSVSVSPLYSSTCISNSYSICSYNLTCMYHELYIWISFLPLPLATYLFTVSFISFHLLFVCSALATLFATEVLSFDMDCKFSFSLSRVSSSFSSDQFSSNRNCFWANSQVHSSAYDFAWKVWIGNATSIHWHTFVIHTSISVECVRVWAHVRERVCIRKSSNF